MLNLPLAVVAAVLAGAVAQPLTDVTSTVFDPVGDTIAWHPITPEFQDMVLGQMTKTASGDFELLMEMAGPVPVNPTLPPQGQSEIWWAWTFNLDTTAFPRGYPLSPGGASYLEFIVYVSWDGTEFAGTAIDRRPLLTGGEAIVTPVPFSIDGTIVEAFLDFTLIGEVPAGFIWSFNSVDWAGPVGSHAFFVPDLGTSTVFNP